jgi:hypothetical protein
MNELKEIGITKLSGEEKFRDGSNKLDFNLLSFWQWSSSDILSNATRGILAEYIVGKALGCIKEEDIRDEWGAYDLKTQAGVRIEVKSAAYVQSWQQSRLSNITFNVPKTMGWDINTNKFDKEKNRQADVYVFSLLFHKDKKTVNPLDISQWEFFVLPAKVLDERERSQHSITLPSLKKLTNSVSFFELGQAVDKAKDEC